MLACDMLVLVLLGLALYLIQDRMLLLLFGLALGDACHFHAGTCWCVL
jgi:hypothetical protein